MPQTLEADYVIVGAGSAGCVLANRLSADGRRKVVLLEAGGDDRPTRNLGQFWSNIMIHTPIGFGRTLHDPKVNWLYETQPDPTTGGRAHLWPKGKVLGGSSSINGLLYVRGQAADYDGWRQRGCEGWSAADVKPYFLKAEDQERGESEHHATGGPLRVSDMDERHPVNEALVEACHQAGIRKVDDYNGAEQEGASPFQFTIRGGRRCSTARAYLHPVEGRHNLVIETNAQALRVLFDGKRAIGVEYLKDDETWTVKARAEVILAAGSVASPQILEASGVGQGPLLAENGVPVVAELPGVGENLQDHYMIGMQWRLKGGADTINERSHGLRLAAEALRYAFTRKGLLSFAVAHTVAFAKSRPELETPDIQLHMMPASMDLEKLGKTQSLELETLPGMTITPCQLRPESRGSVHITSPHATHPPAIRPHYLSDPIDQAAAIAGVKLARKVAAQPALAPYVESEFAPGDGVASDQEIQAYTQVAGTTLYHPVGTCQMGHGPDAVVDPQLRVIGVDGLRVVDASIMPRIVSGNTNAATIMIAEKASDMILGAAA